MISAQTKLSNLDKAAKIIETVLELGVCDFCLCAGARNSPFISLLDENKTLLSNLTNLNQINLYHFFDERAAGFFAIGLSQKKQKPVAIITTSGTAVSELLSPTIEAFYSQVPLILITADRPPQFRGTGAPQSIEQIGIFSHYSLPTIDLTHSLADVQSAFIWNKKIPLHLNVCFDEPLLDGPIPKIQFPNFQHPTSLLSPTPASETRGEEESLNSFYLRCKNPLILVSGLNPDEKKITVKTLSSLNRLLYIETLSGLRGHPLLEHKRLKSGYRLLSKLIESNHFDGIIRIGSVPTTRLWRDLEDKFISLPVLSLSNNPLTGLARTSDCLPLDHLTLIGDNFQLKDSQSFIPIQEQDLIINNQIQDLLNDYPQSQLGLVRKLSLTSKEQPLYLGNSLPIRDWDLIAAPILQQEVLGNRGANGIDGQLSTFFGWRPNHTHSWALLGDLTTLYDLNAPWILNQQESTSWTLAIMNNSGGQIFKPMFHREAFINRHNINFENWAKMWNITYHRTDSLNEDFKNFPQILEITPSEAQSEKLNQKLDSLWKTL